MWYCWPVTKINEEQARALIELYGDPTGRKKIELEQAEDLLSKSLVFLGAQRNYDPRLKYTTFQFSPTLRYVLKKRDIHEQKKVSSQWKNLWIKNTIDAAIGMLLQSAKLTSNKEMEQNLLAWQRTREIPRKEAAKQRVTKKMLAEREATVNKVLDAENRDTVLAYLLGDSKDVSLRQTLIVEKKKIESRLASSGVYPPDAEIYSIEKPPILAIFGPSSVSWSEGGMLLEFDYTPTPRGAFVSISREGSRDRLLGLVHAVDGKLEAILDDVRAEDPRPLLQAWLALMDSYKIHSFLLSNDVAEEVAINTIRDRGFKITKGPGDRLKASRV